MARVLLENKRLKQEVEFLRKKMIWDKIKEIN